MTATRAHPGSRLPPGVVGPDEPFAWFGGMLATGLREYADDPAALDRPGWWAVVADFEGTVRAWRFDRVRRAGLPPPALAWTAPPAGAWTSSLDREAYLAGVSDIRRRIRAGEVYQVNLCRVLSAGLTVPLRGADILALARLLATGNPAPYAGVVRAPGAWVVSASPELFLRREGDRLESRPIKGTGATEADLLPKDDAENVMIVDLVRNDLQRVCRAGTVEVPTLLRTERHPGLVHLVSTVRGRLQPGTGWPQVLRATYPPGSVSGAPKSTALKAITDLEPVPRGPYCGAVGWVDAARRRACLAVGIRTFWAQEVAGRAVLRFGTGAGITWESDPAHEWRETELKAARLTRLATQAVPLPAGDAR